MGFKEVNQQVSFPEEEEKILKFWQEHQTFQKSIDQRSRDKVYTFYDGPPFATGLPHYGHLLAGIIKDIVPRYWAMKGFRIERRFGWDCHGLPVEYEIDKALGISGRAGVEKFGIAKYNEECRKIVLRYTAEWEKTVNRIGRWIDFRNDYKTMDAKFMESVWWVFKQLWDKNLIYKGYRVMPYSTAVATPLSNFEASSNYKDVQDPALTVKFQQTGNPNTFFLAWTTTPWTLLSNILLAVGKDISYVKVSSKKDGNFYILAESRVSFYFSKKEEFEIVEKWTGEELVQKKKSYQPLLPYFKDWGRGAFHVVLGHHVSDVDGTGIVHISPGFGEDDFLICVNHGIISSTGSDLVMPVDDDGKFTALVTDFAGQHIKEADKAIIEKLKSQHQLFRHDTLTHSYPFCWRSDTPLIYRAVSSWFVKVEAIKEKLLKNNKETHWVPETLRDGRFGNWLENARDWNISRSRYWGTPLPIWENKETGEFECVGSIAELEKRTGKKITDLHREHLDDLEISKDGKKFKRVPEVLDCWFESGSMPYAQRHFPFEKGDDGKKSPSGWPADFIAEGLDQTRGWFYTLAILGTALFDKFPFKNVVVNGMVLAEDGKKMSKRLKNYPDPVDVLNTHGADALRLYMIQSPAVRADDLRFSEAGVKDIVRRILLKWWNSYSFFVSYAVIDKWQPEAVSKLSSENILDQWILSRLQSLLGTIEDEMKQYHLYNVVPGLLDFIEDLTNIYIRFNRKRFWQEENNQDKNSAYQTLYTVLHTFSEVMAPFTPFLAENIFQNLKTAKDAESVHLADYPLPHREIIDESLEKSVALMNRVILIVRNIREKKNIKVKIPLKKLAIIHRDQKLLNLLKVLENYLSEELNVREIQYLTQEDEYVELTAKANGASLGKRLGKKFGTVAGQITKLKSEQIVTLEQGKTLQIDSETIGKGDVLIYRNAKKGHENVVSDAFITVELDTTLDPYQIQEGLAREVVSRVQKLRKTADLKLDDRIQVEYQAECEIKDAIQKNIAYIQEQTLAVSFKFSENPEGSASEVCEIDNIKILIALKVK